MARIPFPIVYNFFTKDYQKKVSFSSYLQSLKKRLPTKKEGYIKKIDIIGTDGREYRFVFFQLTNDTDILTAQYQKSLKGKWEWINIDPESCLKENK